MPITGLVYSKRVLAGAVCSFLLPAGSLWHGRALALGRHGQAHAAGMNNALSSGVAHALLYILDAALRVLYILLAVQPDTAQEEVTHSVEQDMHGRRARHARATRAVGCL